MRHLRLISAALRFHLLLILVRVLYSDYLVSIPLGQQLARVVKARASYD